MNRKKRKKVSIHDHQAAIQEFMNKNRVGIHAPMIADTMVINVSSLTFSVAAKRNLFSSFLWQNLKLQSTFDTIAEKS